MSTNATLSDSQWHKIVAFLRTHPRAYVGKSTTCRRFVEAVLWIMPTGAQWRFLPQEYGNWNTVYKRFARWSDHDVWEAMHTHFAWKA
jgi:transposase